MTMPPATLRGLTQEDWPAVERLFGPRGACGGCWCMYWRVERGGKSWEAMKGEPARAALAHLIAAGRVNAVLAYAEGAPVGWCCFGPHGDFPRLERAPSLDRERGVGSWAVTCFYLAPPARGRGLGTALLERAAQLAFARGAAEVEGYPVRTEPGRRLPPPFAWTGTPGMFTRAGFAPAERPAGRRAIYVKHAA